MTNRYQKKARLASTFRRISADRRTFTKNRRCFRDLEEAFLTGVIKRRDPSAGVAIYRASKKAISYQAEI
jgi:hypothetical protein